MTQGVTLAFFIYHHTLNHSFQHGQYTYGCYNTLASSLKKPHEALPFMETETLETLEEKHTKHVNSLFMMCLEILFIFGIPAFGILILYKTIYPDATLILFGLPASFLLSWGIFIMRWKKLSQKVAEVEEKLKILRAEKTQLEEEKNHD